MVLHLPSDFLDQNYVDNCLSPIYWYEGCCPQNGNLLRLPRTCLAEAIAFGLMQHLATDELYSREGKMYGVLLVETSLREQRVLRAFSGLLNGKSIVEGWVPPIPGRDKVALEEARTLAALEALKQELIALQQLSQRQQYKALLHEFETRLQELSLQHRQRKQERQQYRQKLHQTYNGVALARALEQLDEQSRKDGIARRQLKREQDATLQPLQQTVERADNRIRELKQQRKILSRQLQTQMHASYCLTNFVGESLSLQELMPGGIPTGTGDCCTPKLLHYAAIHSLKPLAMAEFWWGFSSIEGKVQGNFYGACAERCQPLLGFLLSGLPKRGEMERWGRNGESHKIEIPILYEDKWLIAVNKPAGLLSVPGRYRESQDSVLSRLRCLLPNETELTAVHRLDQETSGVLLLARDRKTYCQLSQQFQRRQVHKVYEAVLAGFVTTEQGVIELPLRADFPNRPKQKVDWHQGKPSTTRFQVMATAADSTRMEFIPITGRTHQIRVHAADLQGLGIPILGDRLYGCCTATNRLYLHAKELCFEHPQLGTLRLQAETPF
ncbi:MAG: RluA family pseudouridine synthase [Chroococcidiopsidaceae cyanobacterium CP_BM_ER_R8_30]|nr:RluA family pseudouridine synthase [Chroococcidiopsidaceae cyanobacterium CP_BM_ER_R8_30]